MSQAAQQVPTVRKVHIPSGGITLAGHLELPIGAQAAVLFVHGPGSNRHSRRNQLVARTIRNAGLGTFQFDLLTSEEEAVDNDTQGIGFDIGLLAKRLVDATYWLNGEFDYLRAGYFGASTGAAAALVAAAELGTIVGAVVSRSGRPDLAKDALPLVKAATLLIVGELDSRVIEVNRHAYAQLNCEKEITMVPRATHLFQERGAMDQVAHLATDWFQTHLSEHTHMENQNQEDPNG